MRKIVDKMGKTRWILWPRPKLTARQEKNLGVSVYRPGKLFKGHRI